MQTQSVFAVIWSKKGLSSSYLGITALFFPRNYHRRHVVTVAVHRLTSSHTAANIRCVVDEILAEWDIDPNKVYAILRTMVVIWWLHSKMMTLKKYLQQMMMKTYCEADHDIEFHSLKQISCFSHTLQLVVSKFDKSPESCA